MDTFGTEIASAVAGHLNHFARTRDFGRAVIEMLFRLDASGDERRRPDLAFVSYTRWPKSKRSAPKDGWAVVPDLAVEVVSESNTAEAIIAKVRAYFQYGVRLVWVIFPNEEVVYAYDSPRSIRVIERDDPGVDGGAVVPGFVLPLATIFDFDAEIEAPPAEVSLGGCNPPNEDWRVAPALRRRETVCLALTSEAKKPCRDSDSPCGG